MATTLINSLGFVLMILRGELIRTGAQLVLVLKSLREFKLLLMRDATHDEAIRSFTGNGVAAFVDEPFPLDRPTARDRFG